MTEYICGIIKFNEVISPYLSMIFGKYEINQENNEIVYRPDQNQNSGTIARVTPLVEINGKEEAKLIDKVKIKLIHCEKELEELLKR